MNTFGEIYRLTDFGESRGTHIGGVIDGCPSDFQIDFDWIQSEMQRRHANHIGATTRQEPDNIQFLSGIYQGKTTGSPIGFIIQNSDIKTDNETPQLIRPSHADYCYLQKYKWCDLRGGGRASARLTANLVVAGSIAKQFLKAQNIQIESYIQQIGSLPLSDERELSQTAQNYLAQIAQEGDSTGAKIKIKIQNVPAGLGSPLYHKLESKLSATCMGIPAAVGFEYGKGFQSVSMKGSEYNDIISENFQFQSNHSGGIQGGISNGNIIEFSVAFKPIPTIDKTQKYITEDGKNFTLKQYSRHDVCVVPRVLVVVESVTAMVILDEILIAKMQL